MAKKVLGITKAQHRDVGQTVRRMKGSGRRARRLRRSRLGGGGGRLAIAIANEDASVNNGDISVEVTAWEDASFNGDPDNGIRAALDTAKDDDGSFTNYAENYGTLVVSGQHLVITKGDWPPWEADVAYSEGDVRTIDLSLRNWSRLDVDPGPDGPFDDGNWNDEGLAQPGDNPPYSETSTYAADDLVTHSNGTGLRRVRCINPAGSTSSTFNEADWEDVEAASGWKVSEIPHTLATGVAQAESLSTSSPTTWPDFAVNLLGATPTIALTASNPGQVPTNNGDRVLVMVTGVKAGSTTGCILINSETASQGGVGGVADGNDKVSSQSGQTAGFLSAVLIDSPAQTAPWYAVDMVTSGAFMWGRVNVPDFVEPKRFITGAVTADVHIDDATFTITSVRALASGEDPGVNQVIHSPIGSYPAGTFITGVWDEDQSKWFDCTAARFGRLRGLADGAVSFGDASFTVDNIKILAGSRDPGASVTVFAPLRKYLNNEEVEFVWNDQAGRFEDDTPKGFRLIKGLTTAAVSSGDSTFSIDNIVALAGGANPVASTADGVSHPISAPLRGYENNAEIFGIWDQANQIFLDVTPGGGGSETFDFLVQYGQSLSAGSWDDGARNWANGGGTVRLLDSSGNEAGTQAVVWKPNVSVSPPVGKAYRGEGYIKNGTYYVSWVYTCEGVIWTSGS